MIERFKDYPGYLVRLPKAWESSQTTEDAVVFFHGFPSNSAVKNLDLAICVRERLHWDTFVLHYKGLGESPGEFRFTDSIGEAQGLLEFLVKTRGYKKIHIVGHSWGGLVSVNIAKINPPYLGRVTLLSPFCFIEKSESLYQWFVEGVREECPGIFGNQSREEVCSDFDLIMKYHLPLNLAEGLSANIPISILQSRDDDVTPSATTRAFAAKLKRSPFYQELNQDHSFTQDRRGLSDALIAALQPGG